MSTPVHRHASAAAAAAATASRFCRRRRILSLLVACPLAVIVTHVALINYSLLTLPGPLCPNATVQDYPGKEIYSFKCQSYDLEHRTKALWSMEHDGNGNLLFLIYGYKVGVVSTFWYPLTRHFRVVWTAPPPTVLRITHPLAYQRGNVVFEERILATANNGTSRIPSEQDSENILSTHQHVWIPTPHTELFRYRVFGITADEDFWYMLEYIQFSPQPGDCHFFLLLKVEIKGGAIVASKLLSSYYPSTEPEYDYDHVHHLHSYVPESITYNDKSDTLVVLSMSDSRAYEYSTDDLQFLRRYDGVFANMAIAWDPRLCSYWAIQRERWSEGFDTKSKTHLLRLDHRLREMESWPTTHGIASVAVDRDRLVVQFACNHAKVFDLSSPGVDPVLDCGGLQQSQSATVQEQGNDKQIPLRRYFQGPVGISDQDFTALNDSFYFVQHGTAIQRRSLADGSLVGRSLNVSSITGNRFVTAPTTNGDEIVYLVAREYNLSTKILQLNPADDFSVTYAVLHSAKFMPCTFNTVTKRFIALNYEGGDYSCFDVQEYTVDDGKFVRKIGSLPSLSRLVWDSRLCSYWRLDASFPEVVWRLDWGLEILDSFRVEDARNLGVVDSELLVVNDYSFPHGYTIVHSKIDVHSLESYESDCECELHSGDSVAVCPEASTLLFCHYRSDSGTYETKCMPVSNIHEFLRSGGYCGSCKIHHREPQNVANVLRPFNYTASTSGAALEHDGSGNLMMMGFHDLSRVSSGDGHTIERLSPKLPFYGHNSDIAGDGENVYSFFLAHSHASFFKMSPRHNFTVVETFVGSEELKLNPMDLHLFHGITFNTLSKTFLLLKNETTILEYSKHFSFLGSYSAPNLSSLKWDPRICGYWGTSKGFDLVYHLKSDFTFVEAIKIRAPQRVAVIGTELFVVSGVPGESLSRVIDVSSIGDSDCEITQKSIG